MNRSAPADAGLPSDSLWAWRHCPAWVLFLTVALTTLVADLAFKSWSFAHVAGHPVVITEQTLKDPAGFWRDHAHTPIVLIPQVLSLHLMTNQGAVFGLGQGGRWFFVLVSLLALAIIPILFARSSSRQFLLHIALALILAGAMGNLYDRVVYGCVRDMLWLFPDWGLWPWIFNLADAALMLGVGLVMLQSWLSKPSKSSFWDHKPAPKP